MSEIALSNLEKHDTEDGIIEARVPRRKSSQQHTQAGPKKYTKIANELKNIFFLHHVHSYIFQLS